MDSLGIRVKRKRYSIAEIFVIVLFSMSLFATTVFAVSVGGAQLSVFRAGIIVAMALFVFPNISRIKNTYVAFMLFWFVYGCLGVIWSSDKSIALKELYFLLVAYIMVAFYSNYLKRKDVFLVACRLYSMFLVVHNIIGYYEMETRDYKWAEPGKLAEYMRAKAAYPVSVFYNPNDFAIVLLFGIGILAICLKYSKSFLGKCFYVAAMLSSVYLIYRTNSRATLVALFIGVVFFISIDRVKNSVKLVIFLACIILVGFLCVSPIGAMLLNELGGHIEIDFSSGSDAYRLELIKYGWDVFKQTFGLGTGAGNLAKEIGDLSKGIGGSVHFWWLEVLFSYGVLVWAGYLICYVCLLKKCICNARKHSFESRIFASYLVAYVLAVIASSSVMNSETLWCAWAVIIAYESNIKCIESRLS